MPDHDTDDRPNTSGAFTYATWQPTILPAVSDPSGEMVKALEQLATHFKPAAWFAIAADRVDEPQAEAQPPNSPREASSKSRARRPLTAHQRKMAADIVVNSDKRVGRETPTWIRKIAAGPNSTSHRV